MNSKEEFEKRFNAGEFDELLKNASSPEDIVKIANDLGYKLTIDDVLNSELGEDALALVAGGKKDKYITINNVDSYNGNGNQQTNVNGSGNTVRVK